MKTKCKGIQKLLPLYIDKAVSSEQKALIEDHLTDCVSCQKEMELLQKIINLVSNMKTLYTHPDILSTVRARLTEKEPIPLISKLSWVSIPLVIAIVIVIGYIVVDQINKDISFKDKEIYSKGVIEKPKKTIKESSMRAREPHKKRIRLIFTANGSKVTKKQVMTTIKSYKNLRLLKENKNELIVEIPADRVSEFMQQIDKVSKVSGKFPEKTEREEPKQEQMHTITADVCIEPL